MSEDFFGDLGRSIGKAATNVVDKTGEFLEATKIKAQISNEEKFVEKDYRDIGKLIYDLHMEGHPFDDNIVKICDDIQAHDDTIKSFKSDLANLKGLKICPSCSEPVEKSATFCPKCGNTLPVEETEDKTSDIVDTIDAEAVMSDAEDKADDVKDAAQDTVSDMKDKAADVRDTVKDVVSDVKEKAEDVAEDVKDAVNDVVSGVKDEMNK